MNDKQQPTPLTDAAYDSSGSTEQVLENLHDLALQLERKLAERTNERDALHEVLSDVSAYLSVGSGDEKTTAQQFRERIMDGMRNHNDQAGTLITDLSTKLAKCKDDMLKAQTEVLVLESQLAGYLLSIAANDKRNEIIFTTIDKLKAVLEIQRN